MLDIPETLNVQINSYLAYGGLDARDKSRLILATMKEQMKRDLPEGLFETCRIAKEQIRERQKARWQK